MMKIVTQKMLLGQGLDNFVTRYSAVGDLTNCHADARDPAEGAQ